MRIASKAHTEAEEVAQREEPEHNARGAGQGFARFALAPDTREVNTQKATSERHMRPTIDELLAGHEIVVDDFSSAQKVVRARGEETEDGEGEAIPSRRMCAWHRVREFRAQCVGMGAPRSASRA